MPRAEMAGSRWWLPAARQKRLLRLPQCTRECCSACCAKGRQCDSATVRQPHRRDPIDRPRGDPRRGNRERDIARTAHGAPPIASDLICIVGICSRRGVRARKKQIAAQTALRLRLKAEKKRFVHRPDLAVGNLACPAVLPSPIYCTPAPPPPPAHATRSKASPCLSFLPPQSTSLHRKKTRCSTLLPLHATCTSLLPSLSLSLCLSPPGGPLSHSGFMHCAARRRPPACISRSTSCHSRSDSHVFSLSPAPAASPIDV